MEKRRFRKWKVICKCELGSAIKQLDCISFQEDSYKMRETIYKRRRILKFHLLAVVYVYLLFIVCLRGYSVCIENNAVPHL